MGALTEQELAGLVPCAPEEVRRLVELGLLSPGEGGFPSSDVHVIRLMTAFEEAGISLEHIARAVETGDLAFPLGLFLPEPDALSSTYAQLAARLGRPPDLLRRLSAELGLPPPADDRIRDGDAAILALLVTNLDLADDDELSRFARLYGSSMQRLVTSGLQFFDRAVRRRIGAYEGSNEEKDRLVYERGALYTELVRTIVPWLQGRHREHAIVEYLVGVTEDFMEERGIGPRPPRRPPAIAFLDLTGFTAVAEERGDEAAADLAADLAKVVQQMTSAPGSGPVKWLGDGVMFYFSEPGEAIATSLDLVEAAERATALPARIGINAGPVVVQEGDYFGRTVNVAARIADFARPHEVLVSETARTSSGTDGVAFELVGDVPLRGVSRSVRLHRASRAA